MTDFDSSPPDAAEIAKLLRLAGIPCDHVSQIVGGWSYWTFDVDGRLIVRLARSESVAKCLEREIALLPHISSHVPFSVPQFRHVGSFHGRPFVVYNRILGKPVSLADLSTNTAGHLASALTALHAVPPLPFVQMQPAAASVDSWRERYLSLRREAVDVLPTLVEPTLLSQLDNRWATFLERDLGSLSSLAVIHYDLGPEHILVRSSDRSIGGIIDFEEATLGDPAADFVGLWCNFGMRPTRRLVQLYDRRGDARFEARIRFYACLGSYHAIAHGLACGDNTIVADGVTGLRNRVSLEMSGNW
jgi:aminoglycoside 2''-phosphotransferase